MKRIICTVSNDLNHDQRMIRICSSLSNAGFEVMLVGRQLPDSEQLTKKNFRQKRLRLFFSKGKLFYVEFNIRLFFFLLFSKFDIVNAVDLDTLAPGFLVCRLKKKTCTYDAHEYFTEVPELVERPRVKKAWSLLADWLVPRLTHCYTVGQGLADIFEEKYGVPFGVIRNVPFSKPHKALAKPDTPFIVLYQGALNDGRGLEETIQAMAHLQGVELWLAGEGDLSAALRKMTEKLNLARQVKFLGKLTPDELRLVTDKAHIGLNLLKNKGLSYYHSLANKTFDYIQAGVPSLNMDFPEYKKINGQWAVFLLLDNLEPSNIAAEIDGIRHDKEGYHQLVENCRKAAKHFIWEKEEQKLLEIYQNIR